MNINREEEEEEEESLDYKTINKKEEEEEEEEKNMKKMEVRRGPWTPEEDIKLINYISLHGEGRWNSLAPSAGLNRTGKSCRLRWLNYLRPDIRRGHISLQEQLIILQLHSRWGNRWSKIAQHLPGRTDNEIKNYWRTRVHKHAKLLKCDVNSKQFKDTMKHLWMPRLVERIASQNVENTPNYLYSYSCQTSSVTTTMSTSTSSESMETEASHGYSDLNGYYNGGKTLIELSNGSDQVEHEILNHVTNGVDAFENLWSVDEFNDCLLQQHFM